MRDKAIIIPEFQSPAGGLITDFIQEKMACGYRYTRVLGELQRFDRFLNAKELKECAIPKSLVLNWTAKKQYESGLTHKKRVNLIRQLAEFMTRRGFNTYIPDTRAQPIVKRSFVPYIFTHAEIASIFATADRMPETAHSAYRCAVVPVLLRLLYGCGLRISEAVNLTLTDVDISEGILTIRDAKFHKERLVPMAPGLTERIRRMHDELGPRVSSAYLFPSADEGHWHPTAIREMFHGILTKTGFINPNRGQLPRLHDLRHTFAVHCMAKWYREGIDLEAKLPVLAAYMGHADISGTQEYLHLTLELCADLSTHLDDAYGHLIPGRTDS